MRVVICLLLLFAAPAFAEFNAAYRPPQTAEVVQIAEQLRQGQVLDKLVALLNRFISVPGNIPIVAQSCGQVNAYYSPSSREVSICYELVADHAAKLSKKYGRTLPSQRISQILYSDLTFVLLHEVGHSLFDLYQIPVLGKEEDAADEFAAFLLLSTNGDRILLDAPLFMPLMKTPWIIKALNGAAVYGDEHALSEQRMANLICQGFGKNPQGFAEAVAAIRLPQHRAQRCADEFSKLDRDVRGLLGNRLMLGTSSALVAQQGPDPTRVGIPNSAGPLLDQYRCNSCHAMESRRIGPSYREIANRYRGSDVIQQLISSVKAGSVNVWGPIPAPPQRQVSEADAESMIRHILSI